MIEWTLQHPVAFFFLVLFQFIILAINKERLEKSKIGKPLFYAFIVQDWWLNILLTFIYFDPPDPWKEVVTQRMERYLQIKLKRDSYGFKYLLDAWKHYSSKGICWILGRFDKGHCDGFV